MNKTGTKHLTVLRHSKACRMSPGYSGDIARPLEERGEADARKTGKAMKELMPVPDQILSSSAPRALNTAKLIAEQIAYPEDKIIEDIRIYDAYTDTLEEILQNVKDSVNDVLLVGHNPAVSDLIGLLTGSKPEELHTSGLVRLSLNIKSWKELHPGCAAKIFALSPHEIKDSK